MSIWNKTTNLPQNLSRPDKRNVIVTNEGFIRRIKSGTRSKDELLVPINGLANSTNFGTPKPTDMWHSASSVVVNTYVNTYISYSEPLNWVAGKVKMTVANTAGGNNMVARSANTFVHGSNNTVMFRWRPTVAGTYKVQAQTVANSTATAVNLKSTNSGGEAASLVITGLTSNTTGTISVTSS